ncbi:hypothetical protein NM688_g2185 [Phlebia brevispora]|uniref:Uncharacterized protein n=1 Tax=Phlebia brevispora TaxID=194682 RepID=A0ACC1T9J3_9APHY|nr:hypothetical protein NM688_g2185 [Phlebia brevispora]
MPGSNSEGNSTQDTAVGIVVTAPSSPDIKSPGNDFRRNTAARIQTHEHTHHTMSGHTMNATSMSLSEAPSDDETSSRFEDLMSSTVLPPPGPAHFAARRAIWRRPVSFPPPSTEQSAKLVELLEREGPIDSDEVWNRGLDKIWKGVTGGGRLKRRLPMRYLIKILQAGWVRDGTWPRGYAAPEPDDELTIIEPEGTLDMPSTTTTPIPESANIPTSRLDGQTEDIWLRSSQRFS